jgi:hypothetical protein
LLGESGRSRDVNDERHLALLAHLRDGKRTGGIEGADDDIGAIIDHPFAPVAGDVRIGLNVHMDEIDLVPVICQHLGGDQRTAVAALAARGKIAGTRQQYRDLQRSRLGANDGGGECQHAHGSGAGQHATPRRSGCALMCHRHPMGV